MTDRDHFAAATLSGLLASTGKYANGEPQDYAATAYQFADAMLRERERPDLDAGPDAKATEPESSVPLGSNVAPANQTAPPCVETDGSSPAIAQPPASSNGSGEGRPLDDTRPDTKGEATGGRGHFLDSRHAKQEQTCPYVVGRTTLHCSLTPFTLTDEEREAIACAAESYADNDDDEDCHRVAVTLGGLLERTK